MNWLFAFKSELKMVFDEVERRILQYPREVQGDALYFLDLYNVTKPGFDMECMSFMLPFWLMGPLKMDVDSAIKISTANVMGLFYFLSQDEIIDAGTDVLNRRLVPVSNLFYLDFMEQYHSLFPYNSRFWKYLRDYILQWTRSMALEKWETGNWPGYPGSYDLKTLAHKSSPQKAAIAASCILTGNIKCIPKLSKAVDCATVSLQLMDDWQDWKDDLRNNCGSYFLSQVMKCNNVDNLSDIDEFHFAQAVYYHGVFDRLVSIVGKNQACIEKTQEPSIPYLVEYHFSILDKFKEKKGVIDKEKNILLYGGFSNWVNSQ